MLPTILEAEIDSVPETLRRRLAVVGLHAAQLIHELAAPLTVIRMRLELLRQHRVLHSGDAVRGVVAEIQSDADRMERVFSRVRAFLASGQSAGQIIRLAPTDLNSVVQEAVSAMKRWHDGAIAFDEAYADLPLLLLDSDWLCQALVNLLKNACEAVDGASTVAVTTARRGARWVEVTVQDNGPGIEPEDLGLLFVPFATSKTHGLGLGLPLCRAVVTAHGGEIEVDTVPGRGATFRILLPTASEARLT